MSTEKKRIVIVGGGFAGIATAHALLKEHHGQVAITLVAAVPHFVYHPALYRLVTGGQSNEVCIPLSEVFAGTVVEVVHDRILELNRTERTCVGASGTQYDYDDLVLALGSETNYFGIPGLKEFSYGMKSIEEALRLKQHISEVLLTCQVEGMSKADQICAANFVVIGAGATGVEMAGQLIVYARALAKQNGIDPSVVSVELIEGAPKIIPALPAAFTDRIEHHLRGLGINIFLNRTIEREEVEGVYLKDMDMKARTVIWTAGVKANSLYETWKLPVDKRGKVEVDEHLRLKDDQHVFIAGDGAATKYSGWAQTAMADGEHVARVISAEFHGEHLPVHVPKPPANAIPAGPGWAGVTIGFLGRDMHFYGRIGWLLRRVADLKTFLEILPFRQAVHAFRNKTNICEACRACDTASVTPR